jgi:hypothetical protein
MALLRPRLPDNALSQGVAPPDVAGGRWCIDIVKSEIQIKKRTKSEEAKRRLRGRRASE